jgi:hypothetical protein
MQTTRSGNLSGTTRSVHSTGVWGIFKGIGLWLDTRSVRSYPQDMHSWSAKAETLRGLKTAAPRLAATRGRSAPALLPAAGYKRAPAPCDLPRGIVIGAAA